MKRTLLVIVLVLLCAAVWAQGEPVPQCQPQTTYTVPVNSYVPARCLTATEHAFLATVPLDGGLREAVRQMLQAKVVHVPACGKYRVGDSVRYWSMYQVWTAPYKAEITLWSLPELPPAEPCPVPQLDLPRPELQLEYVGAPAPCPGVFQPPCRVGSVVIGRAGDYRETTIAAGAVWGSSGGSVCKPPPAVKPPFPPHPIIPPPVPPPPPVYD